MRHCSLYVAHTIEHVFWQMAAPSSFGAAFDPAPDDTSDGLVKLTVPEGKASAMLEDATRS